MCLGAKAPKVQQQKTPVIPDNKAPDDGDPAATRDRIVRRASTQTTFNGARGLNPTLFGKDLLGE